MILKESKFLSADNSGAISLKCIHTTKRQTRSLGAFTTVVLHKFDSKRKLQKKKKYQAVLVNAKKPVKRKNGVTVQFSDNRVLLFGDSDKFLGTRVIGPVCRELKSALPGMVYNKISASADSIV